MEKRPENHISSYIIQTQEEEIKRIALELHEGVGVVAERMPAAVDHDQPRAPESRVLHVRRRDRMILGRV